MSSLPRGELNGCEADIGLAESGLRNGEPETAIIYAERAVERIRALEYAARRLNETEGLLDRLAKRREYAQGLADSLVEGNVQSGKEGQ